MISPASPVSITYATISALPSRSFTPGNRMVSDTSKIVGSSTVILSMREPSPLWYGAVFGVAVCGQAALGLLGVDTVEVNLH